jgi:hypothetical protein
MTQVTYNFEGGTNGVTIAAGDPNSGTPFDAIAPASLTDGTRAYDNAHAAHGILSGKILASTTDKLIYCSWTTSMGTLTDHFGRIYLYITAVPAVQLSLVRFLRPATGTIASVNVNNLTRFIAVGDTVGTKATGAVAVPINQWVRIEWHIVHSATVGNIVANLYTTPDGTTITETIGNGGNYNTSTNTNEVRFGNDSGGALTTAFWMDDIVAGATSFPGPVSGITQDQQTVKSTLQAVRQSVIPCVEKKLEQGKSIFFPDRKIWTPELVTP